MKTKKSDDAVSPVIGVMLMVVITVVIAGVIAAFGTGMVGDTESAPNVVLDVQILEYYQALSDCGGPDFHIRHVSGDPLDTGEIEIRMSWIHGETTYYSTYSAAENKEKGNSPLMYVKVEYVEKPLESEYNSNGHTLNFGDAVLTPGLRLFAFSDGLVRSGVTVGSETSNGVNKGSPFMDKIFNNGVEMGGSYSNKGVMEYLPVGTPVEITILHIPSNTIIFDKEVIVQ